MAHARTRAERIADTRALLARPELDAWVASWSADGGGHLVPLSVAWDETHLILATEPTAVTTRNLDAVPRARLGLGHTRDVVMIDAEVEESMPADDAPLSLVEVYAAQSGWDPRVAGVPFSVHLLVPVRIQAWREADEIPGRTLMRAGRWLVD
jgi:hypothetical protein